MKDLLRIVIGSDICPTPSDSKLFEEGKIYDLLSEGLVQLFKNADLSIINVECPLTNSVTPISKIGPAIKARPSCINFYRALEVTAACLANNHILDYGEDGLKETVATFDDAGIRTVGAGSDLDHARTPLVHRFSCDRSLAVVAMAESEFCIAGKDSSGANPIDFQNFTLITNLKKDYDKVIVILHAGTEMRVIPRPGLVDLCHFLIDQGADAVIVQHTHCIGGVEHYHDGVIVYGQGNFIFRNLIEHEVKPPQWWEGMLVELVWHLESNQFVLQMHPFIQRCEGVGIRSLTCAEKAAFLKRQEDFARLIQDREQIERSWEEYSAKSADFVLLNLMGASRIPRGLALRGLPLIRTWLWLANYRLVQNMISCESHRELALSVLKNLQVKRHI